jgi:hypothetical protein
MALSISVALGPLKFTRNNNIDYERKVVTSCSCQIRPISRDDGFWACFAIIIGTYTIYRSLWTVGSGETYIGRQLFRTAVTRSI